MENKQNKNGLKKRLSDNYKRVFKKIPIKDKTILKIIAHQKETTTKPGTIIDASIIKNALITNVKRPNVIKFIGNVNNKSKGLTKIFKTPKTIATTIAVQKFNIVIPGDNI